MLGIENHTSMSKNKTKKQIIYEAAARLFRDKGYSATSMRDLAQEVDLKASSLYNHIKSKEEILQEICFNNANRFHQGLNVIQAMDISPVEKIKKLIQLHIKIATEDITSITAFNDEWRHLSSPSLEKFIDMRKAYENGFKKIIEQGIQLGELRGLNISTILYTILSSIRWIYDWYQEEKEPKVKQLEEEVMTILINGIKN